MSTPTAVEGSGRWPSAGTDLRLWLAVMVAVLQAGVAHPGVKLAALAAAAVLAARWLADHPVLARPGAVAALGALVFGLAYGVTPYLSLPALAEIRVQALLAVVGCGVLWTLCFGRTLRSGPRCRGATRPWGVALWGTVAVLVVVLWPGLQLSLAWRGDEDFLWTRLRAFGSVLAATSVCWPLACCAGVAGVALCNPRGLLGRVSRWMLILASLAGASLLTAELDPGGRLAYVLRRYPFLSVWAHLLLSTGGAGWHTPQFPDPALARLLPALAVVLLAIVLHLAMARLPASWQPPGITQRLMLVFVIVSVPLLRFYATMVYIEITLVLLLTCVCLAADRLIIRVIRGRPVGVAWLALGLAPFLKEAAVVFGVAVLAVAAVMSAAEVRKRPQQRWSIVGRWLRLAVVVLVPVALFLYFRTQGQPMQFRYRFYLPNFSQLRLYAVMAQAFAMQLGGLLVVAVVVGITAARLRPWLVLFCAVVFCGYVLFYYGWYPRMRLVDGDSLPMYAGYGRFSLYLLPPVIAVVWHGILPWLRQRPAVGSAVLALGIAINVWLSPVRWDGTRQADWGALVCDTEGRNYPYAELYAWLGAGPEGPGQRVTIIGRRYTYGPGDALYRERHAPGLQVRERLVACPRLQVGQALKPPTLLHDEFVAASHARPAYIVVHEPLWGPRWSAQQFSAGYDLAAAFTSHELRLFAYRRRSLTQTAEVSNDSSRR